jgi:hypothetical protein
VVAQRRGFALLPPERLQTVIQASAAKQRARLIQTYEERFWARVRRGLKDECWLWVGPRTSQGYGTVKYLGQTRKAHREAYRLARGEIPDGMHVLHDCDNPPCCNPNHFTLGTNFDNVTDKVRKGRQQDNRGDKNGRAKLTIENVLFIRSSSESGASLARRFGVTGVLVNRIRRRKAWRHV